MGFTYSSSDRSILGSLESANRVDYKQEAKVDGGKEGEEKSAKSKKKVKLSRSADFDSRIRQQ